MSEKLHGISLLIKELWLTDILIHGYLNVSK